MAICPLSLNDLGGVAAGVVGCPGPPPAPACTLARVEALYHLPRAHRRCDPELAAQAIAEAGVGGEARRSVAGLPESVDQVAGGLLVRGARATGRRVHSIALDRTNKYLMRWAMRRYKRLRRRPRPAWEHVGLRAQAPARALRPLADKHAATGRMTGAG